MRYLIYMIPLLLLLCGCAPKRVVTSPGGEFKARDLCTAMRKCKQAQPGECSYVGNPDELNGCAMERIVR
jgi:hypothetical protein